MMARLFSMSDADVLGDLDGAADFLRGRDGVTGRIGCIGFCMGGRYTLLLACASDRLDVAVDCWGGFIDRATPDDRSTPERPTPPLELAAQLECPLLAADRRRGPQPLARARRRAARARRRERPGGRSRRLRRRRPRVLRRLPPDLPARAGREAVERRSSRSCGATCRRAERGSEHAPGCRLRVHIVRRRSRTRSAEEEGAKPWSASGGR